MSNLSESIILSTGAKMPRIGLGTWKAEPNKVGQAVKYALTEGNYRQVDCAAIYLNEKEIGQTLFEVFSGQRLKREEAFITSKLWNSQHARLNVVKACKKSLSDLKLEYLDLYLMHWGLAIPDDEDSEPLDGNGWLMTEKIPIRETWEAMEKLIKSGLVRAIGVANFTAPMLLDLLAYAKIKPAVNQIELHPYNQQTELVEYCQYNNIAVTAYSPLGSPGNFPGNERKYSLFEDEQLIKIANDHDKSVAQVLLRWAIQRQTIAIPKSLNEKNITQNIQVFDFELSEEDLNLIGSLDKKHRFVDPARWWKIPYFN
jgi:alcohol dehydrogenase (NADP+)